MKHYIKCTPLCGEAMLGWLHRTYGDAAWIATVLKPGSAPRLKWTVRVDWLTAYVQLPEYAELHHRTMDADPEVVALRAILTALGWPETVRADQMEGCSSSRRLVGLMAYLGYRKDGNPKERRGRFYYEGRQVVIYRRETPAAAP